MAGGCVDRRQASVHHSCAKHIDFSGIFSAFGLVDRLDRPLEI
jgi:hypothetical protein